MKLRKVVILAIGLAPLCALAQSTSKPPPNIHINTRPGPISTNMPDKEKLSYAIGMYFGRYITNSFKRADVEVDTNTVLQVIGDVILNKPTRMTEDEVRAVFEQLKAAKTAENARKEAETKAKGDAFLAQFAKSPGTKSTPEGVEYKVIKEGAGPNPGPTDMVTVNYRGTLIDGTEFDRHDGFTTAIHGGIITGWQKILPLMKVGSKFQVVIPPRLAYGPQPRPKIPGNSVLIFDMEMTAIKPGAPALPPITSGPPPGPRPGPAATASSTPVVSGEIIKVPSAEELKKGAKIEVIKTNTPTQ